MEKEEDSSSSLTTSSFGLDNFRKRKRRSSRNPIQGVGREVQQTGGAFYSFQNVTDVNPADIARKKSFYLHTTDYYDFIRNVNQEKYQTLLQFLDLDLKNYDAYIRQLLQVYRGRQVFFGQTLRNQDIFDVQLFDVGARLEPALANIRAYLTHLLKLNSSRPKAAKVNMSPQFVSFKKKAGRQPTWTLQTHEDHAHFNMVFRNSQGGLSPTIITNLQELEDALEVLRNYIRHHQMENTFSTEDAESGNILAGLHMLTVETSIIPPTYHGANEGVEIPHFVKRNNNIVTVSGKNNLCFFQCVSSFLGSGTGVRKAGELFKIAYPDKDVRSFGGLNIEHLTQISQKFQLHFEIYELFEEDLEVETFSGRLRFVAKSQGSTFKTPESSVYLLDIQGHLSLITKIETVFNKISCEHCGQIFSERRYLLEHRRNVDCGTSKIEFQQTALPWMKTQSPIEQIFQSAGWVKEFGIHDKSYDVVIGIDFETYFEKIPIPETDTSKLQYTYKHKLLAGSVGLFVREQLETKYADVVRRDLHLNDLPPKSKFFCHTSKGLEKELLFDIFDYVLQLIEVGGCFMEFKFQKLIECLKKKGKKFDLKRLMTWIKTVPIWGFHSGKYDMKMIWSHFLSFIVAKLQEQNRMDIIDGVLPESNEEEFAEIAAMENLQFEEDDDDDVEDDAFYHHLNFDSKREEKCFESTLSKDLQVIKKGGKYMLILLHKFYWMMKDLREYYTSGSLEKFLTLTKTGKKGFFPYEYPNLSPDTLLEVTELPSVEQFFSVLNNENTLYRDSAEFDLEDEELNKAEPKHVRKRRVIKANHDFMKDIWEEKRMHNLYDLLEWYTNLDVGPFLEALMKFRDSILNFPHARIDFNKETVSMPGVAQTISKAMIHYRVMKEPAKPEWQYETLKFGETHCSCCKRPFIPANVISRNIEMKTHYDSPLQGMAILASGGKRPSPPRYLDESMCLKCNGLRFKYIFSKYKELVSHNNDGVPYPLSLEHGTEEEVRAMYDILKDFVGGPSVIMHRRQEVGVTYIDKPVYDPSLKRWNLLANNPKKKLCKSIKGYDANSLYLWCIGAKKYGHPCGPLYYQKIEDWQQTNEDFLNLYKSLILDWEYQPDISERTEADYNVRHDCHVYGFFVVDIRVEEKDYQYFQGMQPIFKKVTIQEDEDTLGEPMHKILRQHKDLKNSQKTTTSTKLIGSFFGEKIVLATPLLQWYLRHGLKVTRIYSIVHGVANTPYLDFMDWVTDTRHFNNEIDKPSKEGAKLVGNACFGGSIKNHLLMHRVFYLEEDDVKDLAKHIKSNTFISGLKFSTKDENQVSDPNNSEEAEEENLANMILTEADFECMQKKRRLEVEEEEEILGDIGFRDDIAGFDLEQLSESIELQENVERLQDIELDDTQVFYEIKKHKKSHMIREPIQFGSWVFQLAKLRMLEFCYDCLMYFIGPDNFQEMEMDTDSLYIALAGETIRELVYPDKLEEWDTWGEKEFFETTETYKQPGLFKLEAEGVAMICLTSKMYYLKTNEQDTDGKSANKGIRDGQNERLLNFDSFNHTLDKGKSPFTATAVNFRLNRQNEMCTYTLEKTGLSAVYTKKVVHADGVTCFPTYK